MRLVTSKLRISMAGTMLRQGALSHLSSFSPNRPYLPSRWSEIPSSSQPASVTSPKCVLYRPVQHFKLSRPATCVELQTADTRIHNMVKAYSTSAVEATRKCSEIQLTITPAHISDSFSESSSILDDDVEDILDIEDDESVLESLAVVMNAPEEVTIPTSDVCIVGVDPDVSGALAVIKSEDQGAPAEVLDVPCVKVVVGKTVRRRHDTCSIAALVRQLNAPQGSIAYVEQAQPFPKDGKQGWYSTGFGYGAWVGILVASGFQVVPVRAQAWKTAAGIYGREYTKDDSRALASLLFPELSPLLKRKKDHGRADALLIAKFGKKSLEAGQS